MAYLPIPKEKGSENVFKSHRNYQNLDFASYFSNMDGDAYFESVNCGANLAHMTTHAWIFRNLYGKLGMILVAGVPKVAKTKVDHTKHNECNIF